MLHTKENIRMAKNLYYMLSIEQTKIKCINIYIYIIIIIPKKRKKTNEFDYLYVYNNLYNSAKRYNIMKIISDDM